MAQYTPKTWTTGETITAAELNAIEQAAAAAAVKVDADAAYDAKGAATAAQAAAVQRANHTGTQSADTVIDGTTNKAYTAAEKTKLSGVAIAATANSTDAQLRDRTTHTGTQAASTITGLATVATTGSYTDLSNTPTVPAAYTDEQAQDAVAAAFAAGTQTGITVAYNDAANSLSLTATGSTSPNATTTSPGIVQLAGDLAGTATVPTVPGLAAKAPIASPTFTGTVSGVTKAMVGLGNVDNTADTAKPVSTAQQTALNAKLDVTTAASTYVAQANAIDLEGVQDSVAGMFTGGTHSGISFAYDDPNGHINATVTPGAVADATTTTKGAIQLAGDLAGTASAPTVPGLAGKLAAASNLSDLASAATARTNLGLGTAATSASTAFDASGAASTAQAFAIQRANHTGTQSADTLTDGTTNKAFLATERTKLTGIATGATANPNAVASTTVTTIVTLTAAAYTALGTKDAATLYVVTP